MAAEKNPTIIIKRVSGDHAGAHGGAWKVAYADFVTAMMALFMVMWLMAADEETKQNISQYFNNYSPFTSSDSTNRNGSKAGGDASWRTDGDQGKYEEESVVKPSQSTPVYIEEQQTLKDLAENVYDGSAFTKDTEGEKVMLKVPGSVKFKPSSDQIGLDSYPYLGKMVSVINEYPGMVEILGSTDSTDFPQEKELQAPNAQALQLSFGRALSVRNYLVQAGVDANKLVPMVGFRGPASKTDKKAQETPGSERIVRFILKHTRK